MLFIVSTNTNIYFNLAAEEYLLKNRSEDVFMLWRNDPAVVVGKHQNTLREVNSFYALAHNIQIARRLSGGGTVYHDSGNLNFTYIKNGKPGKLVDFRKFTEPVIKALAKMGIETKFEGNNSLTLNGLKISGNAEHVFKSRVLHHGTLLFSTEMHHLREVLNVDQDTYEDKAVKSVRSKVTNISANLSNSMSVEEFQDQISQYFTLEFPDCEFYSFKENELIAINELVEKKYRTWDWIFGWSPKYIFRKRFIIGDDELNVWLRVEKGIIKEANVSGGPFNEKSLFDLNLSLKGLPHSFRTIEDQLIILLNDFDKDSLTPEMLKEAFF